MKYLPKSKACDGKVKHPTYESAVTGIKYMKKRYAAKETLNIYQCPYCGKFHLGNLYK